MQNLINLDKITTLLIDLDETVYPASNPIWPLVRDRIDLYLYERLGFPKEKTEEIRERLYNTYGTTMRGLQQEYSVNTDEYLKFVHAVPLELHLKPDPALIKVLATIPQRKLIFTNADAMHAVKVLDAMALSEIFSGIIDIQDISPYCKPQMEAFQIAMARAGEPDPQAYLFVDDTEKNLITARELGMSVILVRETDHEVIPTIRKLADIHSLINGSA